MLKFAREKRIWFAISFMILTVANWVRGFDELHSIDGNDYARLAEEIDISNFFSRESASDFSRPFGMPLLLAMSRFISSDNSVLVAKLFITLVFSLSVVYAVEIMRSLQIKESFIRFFAILIVLDPLMLKFSTDIATEVFSSFFIIYWVHLYVVHLPNQRYIENTKWIAAILLTILVLLFRPNLVVAFLFMLISLILRSNLLHRGMIVIWSIFSLLSVSALVAFYSWYFEEFAPLGPSAGVGLALACEDSYWPQVIGYASAKQNTEINQWTLDFLINLIPSSEGQTSANSQLMVIGIRNCLEEFPMSILVLMGKFIFFWRPFVVYGAYSFSVFVLSLAILLPLTLAFFYFLVVFKPIDFRAISFQLVVRLLSLSVPLSVLVTPLQIRHRIGAFEALSYIIAAFLLDTFTKRRSLTGLKPTN